MINYDIIKLLMWALGAKNFLAQLIHSCRIPFSRNFAKKIWSGSMWTIFIPQGKTEKSHIL